MTRTQSSHKKERRHCRTCESTEVYRTDERLDDQPRCWDCWEKAITIWRAEMRAAGRCPKCGKTATPFTFCDECRKRAAERSRRQYKAAKAARAIKEALDRQRAVVYEGNRAGQQALTKWRATISRAALLSAITEARGDYLEALAALEPPSWRVNSRNGYGKGFSVAVFWKPGQCSRRSEWSRQIVINLARMMGSEAEVSELRRSHGKGIRHERRPATTPGRPGTATSLLYDGQ